MSAYGVAQPGIRTGNVLQYVGANMPACTVSGKGLVLRIARGLIDGCGRDASIWAAKASMLAGPWA
jgi:hypothetical protein